jgi:hypothetical protein
MRTYRQVDPESEPGVFTERSIVRFRNTSRSFIARYKEVSHGKKWWTVICQWRDLRTSSIPDNAGVPAEPGATLQKDAKV